MAVCEVCGNDYALSFEVQTVSGDRHVFDSIECAAHRIAPVCEHCGCRILGHGIDVDGRIYCGASCARTDAGEAGQQVRDRVATG